MTATPDAPPRPSFLDALAVYFKPRVLIVLFLGFSSGLPLALSGTTLQAWMKTSGVDIRTIGLFAAVGVPYTVKFLWAPVVDAFDVPLLSRWLGRRRGWLVFTQIMLLAAIVFLAFCNPATAPGLVALGALLVATTSATQDIVVDAFRVESLPENEQAAGMASYVAAYRIGMLVSGAGTLVLVSWLQDIDFALQSAWTAAYLAMAVLVVIGMAASLAATEPEFSRKVEADHARRAGENPIRRAFDTAVRAFVDFLGQEMAVVVLIFVALFKLADAMAGTMNTPFFLQLGFSLAEIAAISKGVGFAATIAGGFAGGFIARAYPLPQALWVGALLQTFTILVFSGLALIGYDIWALTFSVAIWSFADALGTVIFVAYLSALCQSPLHTATQYALLTALASIGRTVFSSTTGFLVSAAGWFWFFVICTALAAPGLLMLAWLQRRGHFKRLEPKRG